MGVRMICIPTREAVNTASPGDVPRMEKRRGHPRYVDPAVIAMVDHDPEGARITTTIQTRHGPKTLVTDLKVAEVLEMIARHREQAAQTLMTGKRPSNYIHARGEYPSTGVRS